MDDSNSCSRPTVLGHARYLRYCLAVLSDNLSPGPLWSSSWSLTLYFIHHAFLHPIIIFCLSMGLLTSGSTARPVTMSIYHITPGRRAFSVAGPTAWNSLPVAFRDPTISDACFRRHFKTVLFAQQRRHHSV